QEYVGVTVSIKYFIETVPVSKNLKKIAKIKLPGFDNHVWVPTKSKQIVGIVNQTRSYTTVFVVVNTPISPFNIEVLRQSLSEKLKEINLLKEDVLKVVYVPHSASDQILMTEMEPPGEISEGSLGSGEIQAGSLPQSGMLPGIAKLEMDSNEDPELEERRRKKKRQKRLEEIDLAMKMETTRYLLKARTAYQQEDFDSAITAIRDAIEVNPFSSQAFEMLGSIYYRLGWNGMAVENWQRALELDPTNETLKKYISRLAK
ncbi:MAG: tetratricopeptide repeat protein, partial [SAR324 cluster bacterium]|nr:tetratricopeptide repeat protein [SAR324 cluster bacterium]